MAERVTRMQGRNRFKLGLFGMNCSGSFATTAPERWQAGWEENLEAARLADEAGIELLGRSVTAQPAWSDFPIIVLTGGGATTPDTEMMVRSRTQLGIIYAQIIE